MGVMLKELGVRTDRNRLHWEKPHFQELGWWAGRLGCMSGLSHMSQRLVKILFRRFLIRLERMTRSPRNGGLSNITFNKASTP
jgi:hypothetical protein